MGVSLFTGIETKDWTLADFDKVISFAKQHGIDRLVVKIYEITQGEWYQSIGGPSAVVNHITSQGLDVLTYGFFYGFDPQTEATAIRNYRGRFGRFCLDLEGSFDGNPARMKSLVDLLNGVDQLWISTWANPSEHNWLENLNILTPLTSVWMPQAYDDSLVRAMYAEWPRTPIPIEPTFQVQGTPWQDAKSFNNFSLWEYQLGQQSPGLVDNFVAASKGENVSVYPTNSKGSIVNGLETSEFQPGKTEFACGAFSVSVLFRSTNYNVPNNYSQANLIAWAEQEYAKTAGSNDPSNTVGASIGDMHTYFKDTQAGGNVNALHYWDTTISPTSTQSHDLATIKAAIEHGYPVISTVTEQSVFDLDLGKNPYWWGPTGNHILIWVGIAPDGNLLAFDTANVLPGNLQSDPAPSVRPWPRRYRNSSIDNLWATIVKMPWMPWPPNNDPLSWPPYQPPVPPVPPPPPPTQDGVMVLFDKSANQLIFMDNVTKQVVMRLPIQ